jgi:Na+-driven multidrug efflux pump
MTDQAAADGAPPTMSQMLALWVPLAASTVMMVLEPSTINIALSRSANPELALAAFGVAFSLALVVEAPVLMLLDAAVARAADRDSFVLIRRFTLILGGLVTLVGLVFSLTALYDLVVVDLMNIPVAVADRARPTLQILSFWPLPIAWRRTHQGLLIRKGHTRVITVATGVRLVSLAAALFGGLLLFPERGAVVAGVAMDLSVLIEAAVITWATQPVLRSADFRAGPVLGGQETLSMQGLWRFYQPLAVTTLLRQLTRPLLNAGIAAALLPAASLAAWPVAWSLVILIAGPAWSLQQLTTALASDPPAYRSVNHFSLGLSGLLTLLLGLVAFTPLYGPVMGGVYNLSPALQAVARPAVQWLVAYPLLMGTQSVLRGVLIRGGCTGTVRTATVVNVAVLTATLGLGVTRLSLSGAVLAAIAMLTGTLAEWAWLAYKSRC